MCARTVPHFGKVTIATSDACISNLGCLPATSDASVCMSVLRWRISSSPSSCRRWTSRAQEALAAERARRVATSSDMAAASAIARARLISDSTMAAALVLCSLCSASTRLAYRAPALPRARPAAMAASGGGGGGGYDMSRAQLDPLSGRSFRRDALLQYSSTNQSEPLRILLFALLAAILALAPFVSDEVPSSLGAALAEPPARAACALGAFGASALFQRERGRRTAQLVRLERECALRELPVTLDDGLVRRTVPLAKLSGERAAVLLLGAPERVRRSLDEARVLAPRLNEAEVLLIGVPLSGGGEASSAVAAARELSLALGPREWLGVAAGARQWERFAAQTLGLGDEGSAVLAERGGWIALTRRGRTCGSGLGPAQLDQLLGAQYGPRTTLPPVGAWAEADARAARAGAAGGGSAAGAPSAEARLLEAQAALYTALSAADGAALGSLWAAESAAIARGAGEMPETFLFGVTGAKAAAAEGAARMDDWGAVLADGATLGLQAGGATAAVLGPEPQSGAGGSGSGRRLVEGLTSCLEYPPAREDGSVPPTLLATQRWVAEAPAEGGELGWRLVSHRTIPFAFRMGAMACLRCDARGCVAFNRNI